MKTKKTIVAALAALALLLVSAPTLAWDGIDMWYSAADAAQPGGGGILGTGSTKDHGITCAHCHVESQGLIDLKFQFTPPLPTVGGQTTYEPGQTYQVDVALVAEHLGLSGCDPYVSHTNNFVASFEDAYGKVAGSLTSDSGQSATNCPSSIPSPPPPGTTAVYGDCHAIIAYGQDRTTWHFTWKAPASGSGQLTLYYGAVDGNCDMKSLGDDVKVGTMYFGEATAQVAPPRGDAGGGSRLAGLAALLPVVGLVLAAKRRRRAR